MYPYQNGGRWELYNMEVDRTETNDLARSKPVKLHGMINDYEAWAKRIGVVQWDKLEGRQE